MRSILAGVVLALVAQAVLALAFWAGSVWLGMWLAWPWGGIALAAAVAALLAIALAGDLELDHDSAAARTDLRFGWVARVTSERRPFEVVTRTRVLFVSWTRRRAAEDDAQERRSSSAGGSWWSRMRRSAEPVSRLLSAAAPALTDLIWEAREMRVRIESPTEFEFADRALAALLGRRHLGPLEIQVAEGGARAFQARYRVRLYRAVLIAISVWAQGRPDRVVHTLRDNGRTAGPPLETQNKE